MSVVVAAKTDTGEVVFGSDGRTSYGETGCLPMPDGQGKFKELIKGREIIGFTGDCDHEALFRELYEKAVGVTATLKMMSEYEHLPKLKDEPEGRIDLELLWCKRGDLFIVDGGRTIHGPYPYIAVGKPSSTAMVSLDHSLGGRRQRHTKAVRASVRKALAACYRYDTSIGPPFTVRTFQIEQNQ